jgi:hypothetical protein
MAEAIVASVPALEMAVEAASTIPMATVMVLARMAGTEACTQTCPAMAKDLSIRTPLPSLLPSLLLKRKPFVVGHDERKIYFLK